MIASVKVLLNKTESPPTPYVKARAKNEIQNVLFSLEFPDNNVFSLMIRDKKSIKSLHPSPFAVTSNTHIIYLNRLT